MGFEDFLITTDYDATLTGPDGTIPERNLEAIRYFIEQGGAFTVNTGRSGVSSRALMQVVPANAPFVLMNGSAMVQNGKCLELHTIDLDPWSVMTQLQEAFPGLVTEVQDLDFHYLQNPSPEKIARYEKLGWTYKLVQPGDDVGPFAKFNVYPSEQALREAKTDPVRKAENIRLIDQVQAYIAEHWSEKLVPYRSGPDFLNVHAKGCSKINGARALQKQLGKKYLICIGDAHNDIPMLDGADFAFSPADGVIADRYPNVCKSGDGAVADVICKKIPEILGIQP